MIELNLLPEEFRKRRTKIELPEIPLIPIALAFIGAMVFIQLVLGSLIFLAQRQLARVDVKWKELAPKKAEFDKIKRDISDISKKTDAIEKLIEKRLSWAQLLNELSDSLTPNIWLTELSCDERIERGTAESSAKALPVDAKETLPKMELLSKPKEKEYKVLTLTLSGSASGKGEGATADIARFIGALKENKDFFKEFEEIELVSIKQGVLADKDIMNFTLLCKSKPEEI